MSVLLVAFGTLIVPVFLRFLGLARFKVDFLFQEENRILGLAKGSLVTLLASSILLCGSVAMGNIDAKQKFFEALDTCRAADERLRSQRVIDERAYQKVITDLDAAIPSLTGVMLGRALLLKAHSLRRLFLAKLLEMPVYIEDDLPYDLLKVALLCATRGRQIIEELGNTEDLTWANGLVNDIKGMLRDH